MRLYTINTGFFKLDGGAMFGVVPKSIWNKLNPSDPNNMCTWAMRCLLIEIDNRLILIDNGIGNKQDEKFFSHYYLHGEDNLNNSLKAAGFSTDDITDVFLTHLHFDHCGGSIERDNNGNLRPTFRNAQYWSNSDHWDWATLPNAREKASFLKENILPIQESGQLAFVEEGKTIHDSVEILFMRGHTDAMMIPVIQYKDHRIAFMADLIPSVGHLPLPYVMAYDTRPLLTLGEKEIFLKRAANEKWILFFEHDPIVECCTLHETERGIRAQEQFTLASLG